jgi:hypothetical protein
VAFVAGSAFAYLSNAGAPQARDLAWEATLDGEKWISEVTRQALRLLGTDPVRLPEQAKAVQTKVAGAFGRAKGSVESVLTLANEPEVTATVKRLTATLEGARDVNLRLVDAAYAERAAALRVKPVPAGLTDREREASLMVPRRLFKVYSPEAQKRQPAPGAGGGRRGSGRGDPQTGGPRRLPGAAAAEVANFIDGKRTVLDIYNAVRAECGNLVVGRDETKFTYLLSPDAPDVGLDAVIESLRGLEKNGTIEIQTIAPKPEVKKGKKK